MFAFALLNSHYDTAVHLQKPPVTVPCKFCITSLDRKRLDNLIINAQVQDGIHHAGHRFARAGTHRKQQRILEIAKLLPHGLLNFGNIGFDLAVQ